jgi:hypothetical protein
MKRNMNNKYKRMVIWELDSTISIENIPELMRINYNKEIPYLRDYDVENHEKMLFNRWEPYYDNFNIIESHIMGQRICYIPTHAFIEVPAPEHSAVINGMVLPKANRVKPYQQPVFFFSMGTRVYAIAICAEHMDSRIRSALMGCGRNPEPSHMNWGQVNFSDIVQYRFNSEFFYWLISKRDSTIETCYGDMTLSGIRRLENSSERGDTSYSSEGENILNEAVPKTGLGINTIVDNVGTTIVTTEGILSIVMENDGVCRIDKYNSSINLEGGTIDLADNHLDIVSIMIYAIIIPALRSAYNSDCSSGVWNNNTHDIMCKQCALEAINELCYENNISLEEI